MKKIASISTKILASIILTMAVFSCYAFSNEGKTPTITKHFNLNTPGSLEVKTSGGGINVEGHDGNDVEVKAYVVSERKLFFDKFKGYIFHYYN